jgi:hypothetical protein
MKGKMMEPEQIADVLAETREYIEKHGWVRGNLVLLGGQACIMGGVVVTQDWLDGDRNVKVKALPSVNEVLYAVYQVLFPEVEVAEATRGSLAPASSMVVQWNDTQAETEQEVLDVLAKAEKVTRAGFDPDA